MFASTSVARMNVYAQVFLNGNFEINTANPCDFNLPNATFNSKISNTVGYGGGQELDIMQNCGYGAPQNGTWFIGVASPGGITDAFTMALSTPLIAGNPYTISFYDKGDPSYPPALPVRIGVSTVPGATGTIVYTGPVPALGVWNNRTFGFTAPVSGQYISVSTPGPERWVHVDNFTVLNGLPLSVELIKSETTCSGNSVLLSWSTATETNNDYFIIEKSNDGKVYTETGIIRGAGNSSSVHEYSFTDYENTAPATYYRLTQVDFNGTRQLLSEMAAPGCMPGQPEITVFYAGNQVIDISVISSAQQNFSVVLYDFSGREIQRTSIEAMEGNNHFAWNTTLPAYGMYLVSMENEVTRFTQKLLISR